MEPNKFSAILRIRRKQLQLLREFYLQTPVGPGKQTFKDGIESIKRDIEKMKRGVFR